MIALEIDGARQKGLQDILEGAWGRILARGGIAYDPIHAESFEALGWRFHHVPGRHRRPVADGLGADRERGGVLRPHLPCPFEEPDLLRVREILRFQRHGRLYHLITNKYPVMPLHFLGIRTPGAAPETLPQCLAGAAEIADMLLLCRAIGPPLHFFFNSNSGADGSHSGSTVNHWHVQIFPYAAGALRRFFEALQSSPGSFPAPSALHRGRIPGWEFPHRLYRSSDLEAVAEALCRDARRAAELDIAYNVEMAAEPGDAMTAVFFARAPVPAVAFQGRGELSGRFGGWELTGELVVYEKPLFDWLRSRPAEETALLARERLSRGLRDIW